jgi:hypothetical protein
VPGLAYHCGSMKTEIFIGFSRLPLTTISEE